MNGEGKASLFLSSLLRCFPGPSYGLTPSVDNKSRSLFCLIFVPLWQDERPHQAIWGVSPPAEARQQSREQEGKRGAGEAGTGPQALPGTCSLVHQDPFSHHLLPSQGTSTAANTVAAWNGWRNWASLKITWQNMKKRFLIFFLIYFKSWTQHTPWSQFISLQGLGEGSVWCWGRMVWQGLELSAGNGADAQWNCDLWGQGRDKSLNRPLIPIGKEWSWAPKKAATCEGQGFVR